MILLSEKSYMRHVQHNQSICTAPWACWQKCQQPFWVCVQRACCLQEAEALWQRALQLYSPGAAHVIIEVQQLLSGQAASAPAKSAHVPAPVSRAPHASPSPPATSLPNGSARHTPAKLVQQVLASRMSHTRSWRKRTVCIPKFLCICLVTISARIITARILSLV